MTKQQKITLSASRDIPFNKLLLSQSNVRHVKAGVSIEELAEGNAPRTLLGSITVRPVLDENGAETGMYTIPAGGRRFRALELLVKQKRMNKTALVPCIVRMDGLAEEESLAENIQRAPLHPLDQLRAFQAIREKGFSIVFRKPPLGGRPLHPPGRPQCSMQLMSAVSPKYWTLQRATMSAPRAAAKKPVKFKPSFAKGL